MNLVMAEKLLPLLGSWMLFITTLITLVAAGPSLKRPSLSHLVLFLSVFASLALALALVTGFLIVTRYTLSLIPLSEDLRNLGQLIMVVGFTLAMVTYYRKYTEK